MVKRFSADERALAALAENPFLGIAGLMKAARVSSTCAIRVLRENPPPPGATASAPTAVEDAPIPAPTAAAADSAPATPSPRRRSNGLLARQARSLLRQQLAAGPKPGAQIEAAARAAAVSTRSLLAAADALGVLTRRGEWFLPS